jgi:hypothetical protein
MLYEFISKKQFPTTCPAASSVQIYQLGNIGWTHSVGRLVESLMFALFHDKLFVVPRSEFFRHDPPLSVKLPKPDGRKMLIEGTWRWSDSSECDNLTLALNPWKCHFIPLTNCTHVNYTLVRDANPRYLNVTSLPLTPFSNLTDFLYNKVVRTCDDGPSLDWKGHTHRLLAFVQRPNIQTRSYLRGVLNNLRLIESAERKEAKALVINNILGASQVSNTRFNIMLPCIGVHVRNGDIINDDRARSNIDRSFKPHAILAKKMGRKLGINNFYLATDNSSVLLDAATSFRKMNWFTQSRTVG